MRRSDIVWYNSQTGETQIWFMDGNRLVGRGTVVDEGGTFIPIGPPFSIVGVGDMNGNGKADIVWYNSQTGETQIWFMNANRIAWRGTVVDEGGTFIPIGPPFSVVGVAAFSPPPPPPPPAASVGPFEFNAPIVTGGLAALGGSVRVTLNPDGSVRWQGQVTNSGIDSYDYGISAIVRAGSGRAFALAHAGSIPNRVPIVGDVIRRSWDQTRPPGALPAAILGEFSNAQLQTNLEYRSGIGSALEEAVGWLLKFGAGTALGPLVGAVVFIGVEVGSLISTGSLVPGARLVGSVLWMAGPANTLFAIAAEGIAAVGSRAQELPEEAYNWANGEVFDGSLPPRDKLVHTDTIGGGNRAFTFPRFDGKITLNMGPDGWPEPRNYHVGYGKGTRYPGQTVKYGEVLIHELVHACQIHHASINLSLLADALASKVCEATGKSPYVYGPADTDYSSFNLEQQAQVVSDWFAGAVPNGSNQTSTAKDIYSPYFWYVNENVRVGRF